MAIIKSIIAGFLALLLALPSPALCYADVVADEGVNHVSEAQNSQEDGKSFEDQSGTDQPTEQKSPEEQQSNSTEPTGSNAGNGTAKSAFENAGTEEGLEIGNYNDNTAVRSSGFDPSDYPAEYSDPAINSYLGYSRDDLQEAIKQFYDSSETRELSDEENYQATLALFAWYYLDYGSTDDLVQAAVSSDWILNAIVGIAGFSTKDLAYTIIYSLFGSPGSWGADAPYDVYSVKGIAWYIANIDSKSSSIYSQVTNIYNRLGSIDSGLNTIGSLISSSKSSQDLANDRLAQLLNYFLWPNTNNQPEGYLGRILNTLKALDSGLSVIGSLISDTNNSQDLANARILSILQYLLYPDLEGQPEGYLGRILNTLKALDSGLSVIGSLISDTNNSQDLANARILSILQYLLYPDLEGQPEGYLGRILNTLKALDSGLSVIGSLISDTKSSQELATNYLFDDSTKRPLLQVISDRLTAFVYQIDASQKEISSKLDPLATDETLSTELNKLDSHLELYLFGNNLGLPAHTEFLDNGLIYYIVQIHDDNKAFFYKALEYLEYFKDRLFYIEYDLVDYGMDIEPGFNRVVEAINTKQFEIKLDNAEININLSGIESRLDTIITMLGIAGTKDLLETFLGDFNLDASSALATSISSAMQNVFPFCIPAILKQCLGLMQAESHAPVFEFNFFGSLLILDFTAQGFCDISQVTSWFCRISFLILLLVNTKKFIFTINNRGAQDG